jgi:hypothetical protein
MFDMTNDSDKFRTEAELVKMGAYRVAPNRWKKGAEEWVPLYEGKMVQAFDHRAASVIVNPDNIKRPAQPESTTDAQHADPNWLPNPQFWVSAVLISEIRQAWTIGLKHVSSATNARTVICAIVPRAGYGNSLPVLDCDNSDRSFKRWAPLLLANLNSFALDFIARQKLHGNNLNLYVIEQLPVIPLDAFARTIGSTTAEAIIRDHVLRLSYTAHDLKPFAEDLGHQGAPFPWDPEERLHLRARLDALFFLLYGLDRDAADDILGTFPIVREEEEKQFGGRFRSRELILGYMAAFSAGDADSRIAA